MKESFRIDRLLRRSSHARNRAATLCTASCPSGYDDGYTGFELFEQGIKLGEKAYGDYEDCSSQPGYGTGEIWYAEYQDLVFFFVGSEDHILYELGILPPETEEKAASADLEFLTWLEDETEKVRRVEKEEGGRTIHAYEYILAQYRRYLSPHDGGEPVNDLDKLYPTGRFQPSKGLGPIEQAAFSTCEAVARKLGWSEEANCPFWSYLESAIERADGFKVWLREQIKDPDTHPLNLKVFTEVILKYKEFASPEPPLRKTTVEIEGSTPEEILDALSHCCIFGRIIKEEV